MWQCFILYMPDTVSVPFCFVIFCSLSPPLYVRPLKSVFFFVCLFFLFFFVFVCFFVFLFCFLRLYTHKWPQSWNIAFKGTE